MSFDLSFPPEFFVGPYDLDGSIGPDKPTSVYQAIESMPRKEWRAMCADVFPDSDPGTVSTEMVMETIRETDACLSLTPPIEVYIDAAGHHSVLVHEGE